MTKTRNKMSVTPALSALRDILTSRLLGRHVARIKKAASVILNEVKNLSSCTMLDCVKTALMVRPRSTRTFVLPFLFLMAGCGGLQKTPPVASGVPQAEAPRPTEAKPEPEVAEEKKPEPPAAEQLALPKFERATPPKVLPPSQPIDPKRLVPTEEPLMINVDGMPLPDFISQGIGGTLKVSVYIDEQVKNMKDTITLRMGRPLPAPDVLALALGVLEKKNLIVEEKAGTLYVFRARPVAQGRRDIRVGRDVPDSPAEVLQVVVLKYARTADLEPIIKQFYPTGPTGVTLSMYPRENAVLLAGQASAVKGVVDIIDTFDVPYVEGKKALMLKLVYWQSDEFVRQITQILEGIRFPVARGPGEPGILFIPIRFLNSVLVLAPDDIAVKFVLEWKERLDTAESAGTEEKAFTYIPDYAKATEIVESIKRVYGIYSPQPASPGQPPVQYPGMTPASRTTVILNEAQQAQPQQGGAPGRPAPSQPGAIPGLRMAADERRNVVMTVTTPSNYKSILALLKELDTPVKQVLMEATIAELTLSGELSLGFEFFIKQKVRDGTLDISTLGDVLKPLSPGGPVGSGGLTVQYISATERIAALLDALQTDSKINILSRPRLMVLNNQEATIQVGSDVPTISSQVSAPDISTGTPSILQNIQYRSTGVILRIKPTINSRGLLTLDIAQEVSTSTSTDPTNLTPTILTRKVQTSVVAGDGQTVVLGGIMQENNTGGQTKVPWLGDIPVLGFFFRKDTSKKDKTELVILISPRILASVEETTRVTEELKQELKWLK